MCDVYASFGTRLHFIKKIETPLKILEITHPSADSKSRDYFSRKLKELGLYQEKGTFLSTRINTKQGFAIVSYN